MHPLMVKTFKLVMCGKIVEQPKATSGHARVHTP